MRTLGSTTRTDRIKVWAIARQRRCILPEDRRTVEHRLIWLSSSILSILARSRPAPLTRKEQHPHEHFTRSPPGPRDNACPCARRVAVACAGARAIVAVGGRVDELQFPWSFHCAGPLP